MLEPAVSQTFQQWFNMPDQQQQWNDAKRLSG